MKIYLLRHTRVDVPSGICYGQTDVSLADTFENELGIIKKTLSDVKFEKVYSSPLTRCMYLAKEFSDDIISDERLMELDFGDWENKSWDEIFDCEKGKKWFSNYLEEVCPNGESSQMLQQRIQNFIDELPKINDNILIVTHSGAIRMFRIILEGWSTKKAFDTPIAYGQVTVINV